MLGALFFMGSIVSFLMEKDWLGIALFVALCQLPMLSKI